MNPARDESPAIPVADGPAAAPTGPSTTPHRMDALRRRDAPRREPVRWRYVEAMVRRTAAHTGPTRVLLDRRVDAALAALEAVLDGAPATAGAASSGGGHAVTDAARPLGVPSPLAALVHHLERLSPGDGPSAGRATTTDAPPTHELRSVQRFRATWTRLRVDRQMARARARAPENPGPLNSQLLALRALQCMKDLSPAYLAHFIEHVETLAWLEHRPPAAPALAPTGRRDTPAGERRREPKPSSRPRRPGGPG